MALVYAPCGMHWRGGFRWYWKDWSRSDGTVQRTPFGSQKWINLESTWRAELSKVGERCKCLLSLVSIDVRDPIDVKRPD